MHQQETPETQTPWEKSKQQVGSRTSPHGKQATLPPFHPVSLGQWSNARHFKLHLAQAVVLGDWYSKGEENGFSVSPTLNLRSGETLARKDSTGFLNFLRKNRGHHDSWQLTTAVSDENTKSEKASTAACKDPATPSHVIVTVTLSLLVLISTSCILKGLLILVQLRDIELIGNFLWIISAFSQEYWILLLRFPREVLNMLTPSSSTFREILLSTWRSSLCPGGCDTHREARGLLMRPWDILGTSAPYLLRNKIIRTKFFLSYAQTIAWHIQQQS